MSQFRRTLLSWNNLAKSLGFTRFIRDAKINHHLELNPKLDFKSVLVLAPHPDDDVFGCAGTLTKMQESGAKITVAYFCDGSGGVEEGEKDSRELIEIRKSEAKNAGEILGYSEQIFFGYRDGHLAGGQSVSRALQDLIGRVKPDIIFTPSFLDNHPDHRAVNEVLINMDIADNLQIFAYEVWTPIYVNRIFEINSVKDKKDAAIQAQKSQLETRGYDRAIMGLNQYRAEINNISGYAEGFFATTYENYKKFYQNS